MTDFFDCTGRTVLVTGASGDIGAEIARTFAGFGANVAVHYVANRESAECVADSIRQMGRQATTVSADIANARQVSEMVEATRAALGHVDIAVNNAGVRRKPGDHKYILEVTESEWDAELDSHVKGAFLVCKAVLPEMIERNWGRIINLSSVVARSGGVGASVHYPAAKSGVIGFTKALATQVAGHGVTANVISPGIIDTERVRWRTPAQMKDHVSKIPVGRLGTVSEIAAAAIYFASEAAGYTTGATLDVNGGLYMA